MRVEKLSAGNVTLLFLIPVEYNVLLGKEKNSFPFIRCLNKIVSQVGTLL